MRRNEGLKAGATRCVWCADQMGGGGGLGGSGGVARWAGRRVDAAGFYGQATIGRRREDVAGGAGAACGGVLLRWRRVWPNCDGGSG